MRAGARAGAPRRGELLRLALVSLFFLAAPTAGDIGGCGQEAQDLDARKFFQEKERIDCRQCFDCNYTTKVCEKACDLEVNQTSFPDLCYPLVHDGEVCLNALDAASCKDYASYISDEGASVPTECNFCPPSSKPTSAMSRGAEVDFVDPEEGE